ncbi:hypothetical protein DNTS_014643 [Danionella cerebrum]|uniref:Selenoprotein T n=1 Tax=Danionella cerebrum TaxID=2873325 RepID=A0A553R8L3_9TELE|nr:hypothetical protein DNTS_014643 [Danionella translucida]
MAEYSQTGLLTALLLFTAVTVKDIYMGRNAVTQQERTVPELNPQRPNKQAFYTGPVLKFQYCKVFQEYSRSINQLYPDIRIEGENYPPKPVSKYIGNFISYFKLLAIALIVTGQNPFQMLGINTPRIWSWGQENKIFSCLMAFFLSNMLETHFLSTGAFEITLNDIPIWSKLQSGYVPNIQELFQILDNHLKMNQADKMNFPSPRGSSKRNRSQMSQRVIGTIDIRSDRRSNTVHSRVGPRAESYILSSDEEDEESGGRLSPGLLTSLQSSSQARSAPVSVSCPVCMDIYSEIIDSGRLMVSTKCGHLFCSQCIRDSLSRAHSCPTCRKKLTYKQYHPIYI